MTKYYGEQHVYFEDISSFKKFPGRHGKMCLKVALYLAYTLRSTSFTNNASMTL